MAKRKTNIEFVTDAMDFSKYGPLAQAFIMDAIGKLANAVAESEPRQFDTPFFTGETWVGVAKELKEKIDAHYKS